MKIAHVINDLGDGGAESILFNICKNNISNQHHVVSLTLGGKYKELLKSKGIEVYEFDFSKFYKVIPEFFKLIFLLKKINPNIVQTWMYHADLIGGLASRIIGIKKIFWGIHNTNIEKSYTKRSTRIVVSILKVLSYLLPEKIICCANSSKNVHITMGYCKKKMITIENGYDPEIFTPGDFMTSEKQKVYPRKIIFGTVGRYNPVKDYKNLLTAFSLLSNKKSIKLILVGTNLDNSNIELVSLIKELELCEIVELLGRKENVQDILKDLDFFVLSSSSEAFPNVLAEAMLCGVPCISTNAGDAAHIIGDTGWTAPIKDSKQLAEKIELAIKYYESSDINKMRILSRQRIIDNFTIDVMINKYNQAWLS